MDRPWHPRCSEWMPLMRIRIVSALALSVMLAACGDTCSSELLATSESPNGGAKVSFFRANCGATTGYRYDVQISQGAEAAGDTILRFDDNHARDWVDDDRKLIEMAWLDDKNLEIRVLKPIRIFDEESTAGGIAVRFNLTKGSVRL